MIIIIGWSRSALTRRVLAPNETARTHGFPFGYSVVRRTRTDKAYLYWNTSLSKLMTT